MRYLGKSVALFWLFLSLPLCLPLSAADYRISLEAESGFFEREDELVKAEIDFKRGVDGGSFFLVEGEQEVPFYFIPQDKYRGELYWVLAGTTDALSSRTYHLSFSGGGWRKEAWGSEEIAGLAREKSNLVPNYSFEEERGATDTSTWKGRRKPLSWKLNDYAHALKNLPGLKSLCRLSKKEAYAGENSLKIVSEAKEGKNITGFASSSVFPLKPETEYKFSIHLKITEREDNNDKYQSVNAEIQFLDGNKERVHPRDHGLNRLLLGYLTTRHPRETYLGQWVKIEGVKMTPAEVRYGRVMIHPWFFSGTVYYDNLTLSQLAEGDLIQVEVGEIEKKR